VSSPKLPFVKVKIRDLTDDELGVCRKNSAGTTLKLRPVQPYKHPCMNELWDVYTLTNIAGMAVSFSALSLLLIWLFSGILQRTQSGTVPVKSRDPNRTR